MQPKTFAVNIDLQHYSVGNENLNQLNEKKTKWKGKYLFLTYITYSYFNY